jgi:GH15 family glucan-1,4-alpha-glucosidase
VARGLSVLGFLEQVYPRSGRWAARYEEDGSGPVADRRGAQLDGSGWVPWAVGFCAASGATDEGLRDLWPMVRQSAEHAVSEMRRDGLPNPSPDYWERPEKRLTLGTVAPLIAGLRAAAAVADRLAGPSATRYPGDGPAATGDADTVHTARADAERWRGAADRLQQAVDARFGRLGYPRDTRGGADSIVTVLGPPFSPARPQVSAAIRRSQRLLTLPNGGVTPGQDWRADGIAWTPSTALFGLSAAARGDRATAEQVLRFLDDHRTPTGALPEKITQSGKPAGEAPLAWTSALVVLTQAALTR